MDTDEIKQYDMKNQLKGRHTCLILRDILYGQVIKKINKL